MSEILSKQHTTMALKSEANVYDVVGVLEWRDVATLQCMLANRGIKLHKSNIQKYLNRLKAAGKVESQPSNERGGHFSLSWRRVEE